jgi:hypothetical protein
MITNIYCGLAADVSEIQKHVGFFSSLDRLHELQKVWSYPRSIAGLQGFFQGVISGV